MSGRAVAREEGVSLPAVLKWRTTLVSAMDADAWVALGSNRGDRIEQLRSAIACLRRIEGVGVRAVSPIYETIPVGPSTDLFLNAVARLATRLPAERLLSALQQIEDLHGRQRVEPWGPRTLDLDLLLFTPEGGVTVRISTSELELPHPRMYQRDFVLVPWADLAPTMLLPNGATVAACMTTLDVRHRTIIRKYPVRRDILDEPRRIAQG